MRTLRDRIDVVIGGESVALLAQRALFWPRERTLFVADVHLGKAASFRAAGVPVPSGHSRSDLARLSGLIREHDVQHLIVLGDWVHDANSYTPALDQAMREFRSQHASLKQTLVMGNHDDRAGAPPQAWSFTIVEDTVSLGAFLAAHEPAASYPNAFSSSAAPTSAAASASASSPASALAPAAVAASADGAVRTATDPAASHLSLENAGVAVRVCGHIHPSTWLRTPREALNLPCFWLQRHQLILPSFGELTGRYTVSPAPDDVTYVVTGQQIFRNPSPAG